MVVSVSRALFVWSWTRPAHPVSSWTSATWTGTGSRSSAGVVTAMFPTKLLLKLKTLPRIKSLSEDWLILTSNLSVITGFYSFDFTPLLQRLTPVVGAARGNKPRIIFLSLVGTLWRGCTTFTKLTLNCLNTAQRCTTTTLTIMIFENYIIFHSSGSIVSRSSRG